MRAVPFIAFFLSGASSLIFQSLWTRMLHHVFGATSVAISSVLTAFMAGLGLGAWLFGRYADRIRRPLLVYAAAELGVGLCGLLIPTLVRADGWLSDVNGWLRYTLEADSFGFMLARFACVLPILIVPTTLMGSTLPLLARHFVPAQGAAAATSRRVGALYAVNTLGAVAGVFLGSFVLMPWAGVHHTNLVAVSLNLLLAASIWLLRKQLRPAMDDADAEADAGPVEPDAPSDDEAPATLDAPISPLARKLALWTFGVSGACALGYEVVWSRALSMVIGSSVHSFALILLTFLVGIAGGSALASAILPADSRVRSASRGVWVAAPVATALTLVAMSPTLAFGDAVVALTITAAAAIVAFGAARLASQQQRQQAALGDTGQADTPTAALWICTIPIVVAACQVVFALQRKGSLSELAVHGHLPYIAASVVLTMATFLLVLLSLRRSLVLLAACMQLYIALATFGSYVFQDEIPYTFARLVSSIEDLPAHVGTVRFFMFATAGLCTLGATLGMGAMFPITMRLWSSGGQRVGRDVGVVYTSNTLGSIVGSWLPGFVLMPWLGMERTLAVGIWLNLALALTMAVSTSVRSEGDGEDASRVLPRWQRRLVLALSLLIAPLGAAHYLAMQTPHSPLRWNLARMTLGPFRMSLANDVLDPTSWGEPDLVYYRDGISTTVSVEKWGRHLAMKNNGKVDASNGDDMPTQIMVASYPLLLHARGPRDLDVALVGFGSGVTVGAALQFPVRRLDTIELERNVVEAAVDYFADVNHMQRALPQFPYVKEQRLRVLNDDGRNFLASTRRDYDVIISEPSNPWITGVSDLFTVDHFRITKKRLKPDGVYCQWVQLYEMSPDNIKTIYRTFAQQFEHVLVFSAEDMSSDTILVGSDKPLPLHLQPVAEAMKDRRIAAELERAYIHSPHDVFGRVLFASKDELLRYTQYEERKRDGRWQHQLRALGADPCEPADCRRSPAPLNTDDNMRIELAAPRDLIGFSLYDGYLRTFYAADWPYGDLFGRVRHNGQQSLSAEDDAKLAVALAANGRGPQAARFAERATSLAPDSRTAAQALLLLRLLRGDLDHPRVHLQDPVPGPQMDPGTADRLRRGFAEVRRLVGQRAWKPALDAMEAIPSPLRLHSGPALRLLYGQLLYLGADGDRALLRTSVHHLEDSIREDAEFIAQHPEAYYFLARALHALASHDKALRNMRAYMEQQQAGGVVATID